MLGFNPLQEISKTTGESMSSLYDRISKGTISVDEIKESMKRATSEGGQFYQSMEKQSKTLNGQLSTLKDNFNELLGNALQPISDALRDYIIPEINDLLTGGEHLKAYLEEVKTFIDEHIDAIIIMTGAITALTVAITAFYIAQNIATISTKLFTTATTIATAVSTAFGTVLAFITSPITLIILAIGALVVIIILLVRHWDLVKEKTLEVWGKIKEFLKGLYDKAMEIGASVVNFIQGVVDKIVAFFTETIPNAFMSLVEKVTNFISGVIQSIANFIDQVIFFITHLDVYIGYFIGKVGAEIVNGIMMIKDFIFITIPETISNIIAWLGDLWEKIKVWFANTVDSIVNWLIELYQNIKNSLIETYENIKQWGIDTWNWVKTEVPKIINNIVNFFKELPGKIWTWLTNTIQKFVQFLTDMKTKADEGAKKVAENIVNAIKELPGKMLEIGKNIVEGIWNGITGAVGWLNERISNFCAGVMQGFKDNLKIGSPSKLFRDEVGKNIALGIGVGFENTIAKVYGEMESAISNETAKLGKEMTATGNVSIERNANVTSLLNGLIEQENTFTSNVMLDSKIVASAVNKVNKRNAFASGIA